jgi:hypothetical protein
VLKLLLARQFDPNPVITQEKLALKKYINPKNWHMRVVELKKMRPV